MFSIIQRFLCSKWRTSAAPRRAHAAQAVVFQRQQLLNWHDKCSQDEYITRNWLVIAEQTNRWIRVTPGKTNRFSLVKYPFNDFSYRTVFHISSSQKTQIFYSIRQHIRLQNFTNMYTRLCTQNWEKYSSAGKNNHNFLRDTSSSRDHKIWLHESGTFLCKEETINVACCVV